MPGASAMIRLKQWWSSPSTADAASKTQTPRYECVCVCVCTYLLYLCEDHWSEDISAGPNFFLLEGSDLLLGFGLEEGLGSVWAFRCDGKVSRTVLGNVSCQFNQNKVLLVFICLILSRAKNLLLFGYVWSYLSVFVSIYSIFWQCEITDRHLLLQYTWGGHQRFFTSSQWRV